MASLIETVTNKQLTIDDVSVFDTLPHSPEGTEDNKLVMEAETIFSLIVKAKKPDAIICCYQKEIRLICLSGVFAAYGWPRYLTLLDSKSAQIAKFGESTHFIPVMR